MSAPTGDETPDYDEALPGAQTELAPSSSDTEAHTAWSLDAGPEWKPPFWTPGRITAVAVGVATVAALAAAGLVGYHLRPATETEAAPATTITPPPTPTTTAAPKPVDHREGWGVPVDVLPPPTKTVAAPPKTVTVQAVAPPVYVPPPVDMTAFDGQFIRNMLAQGWQIWNPDQSADTARLACSMLHNGADFEYVASFLATKSQARMDEGRTFTSTAMRTYPNCP